jgi:hypothetical protein
MIMLVITQIKIMPIMETHMTRMMEAQPGNQAGPALGASIARMSLIIGIVVQAIWLLIKLFFYGGSSIYLLRPKIRDLYST